MDLDLQTLAERRAEEAQQLPAFSTINLRGIRGSVSEALSHFGRGGILDEYTKHDMTHIDAMLRMYDWLIPDDSVDRMTPADWLLLTLSTYLHDFGLLVTRDEFEKREECGTFVSFRRRILNSDDAEITDYRSHVLAMTAEAREKFLYQEFARTHHATRIRNWMHDPIDLSLGGDEGVARLLHSVLQGLDDAFVADVATVCESHHENDLNDLSKYPPDRPYGSTRAEEANVQYSALLVRTADLLHITRDRVPAVAALLINPRDPISQVEWAKQSAVRTVRPKLRASLEGDDPHPAPDTIEVHANFTHAEGYFGLTQYLLYAQKQLTQSHEWSRGTAQQGLTALSFPWRKIDDTHIAAKGFVTEKFQFTLDQDKILELLTGHTLYNDSSVAVRELLQNALDAVRLRAYLKPNGYTPRIVVKWNSSDREIEVTDNGVGMSESTIKENFLRAGSSGYQTEEFRRNYPDFSPISRFGIGVLSTFMIADKVTVVTSHPSEEQARRLTLRDVHGQYLVRLLEKSSPEVPTSLAEHGTAVRLKLRPSARPLDVLAVLRRWVVIPGCQIEFVSTDLDSPITIGSSSSASALKESLVTSGMARTEDSKLIDQFGAEIKVKEHVTASLDLAYAVRWNRWNEEWNYLHVNREPNMDERRSYFGLCVGGVRITSQPPGYRSSGIAAIANTWGDRAPRTNVARSSLESTEEFNEILGAIYEGYASHIADEISASEERRRTTVTRAASAASYLASTLYNSQLASLAQMDDQMLTLPTFVVEVDGTRQRQSLVDLRQIDHLTTLQSRTILGLENVLYSARGGSRSSSLLDLWRALGLEHEQLDGKSLLCGPSLASVGPFARLFKEAFEVFSFQSSDDGRTLIASWRPIGEDPQWIRPAIRDLPNVLGVRDARVGSRHMMSTLENIFICATSDFPQSSIDENLVRSDGMLYVLPGNPLFGIKGSGRELSDRERAGYIALIIAVSRDSRVRQSEVEIIDELTRHGLNHFLDIDSVGTALDGGPLEVFDVMRWDRRQESDGRPPF